LLPRKSLVAAVPISLRAAGDASSNNQASMSLISLGTHIADPARRLAHVKAAGATMKSAMGSVKNILPTDFPSIGMPWLIEAATALVGKAKVADRIGQVANVTISNVPGPPVPLYMAGARMLDLQDRIGSLDVGKDADFIILNGDPFSVYTRIEQTWVEGDKVFDFSDPAQRGFATGGMDVFRETHVHVACEH
jgi:hypothetical protein